MRELTIAGKAINDQSDAYVIAEIGHNHGGSVQTCKDLFYAAKECGCDGVKLQKRDVRTLFTREMLEAPYHSEHAFGPTYGEHRAALEFDFGQIREVAEYAHGLGLAFGCTAFDVPSADGLAKLEVDFFKIASGDLKTIPLIRYVLDFGKPTIISTGGGTLEDIKRILADTMRRWNERRCSSPNMTMDPPPYPQPAFLQCTAAYPCEPSEMDLRVIETYRRLFRNHVVGLSDHQDGISIAPVAYALGARIFEKHFTLDHNAKGSDHRFSLEPDGMKRMVRDLKRTREALGDGVKRPYESEQAGLRKMAKSLVAARELPVGHVIEPCDLTMKSPNGGLEPWKLDKLIGRRLVVPFKEDQIIDSSGVFE